MGLGHFTKKRMIFVQTFLSKMTQTDHAQFSCTLTMIKNKIVSHILQEEEEEEEEAISKL
jgi:hypothetical protein